MSAMTVDETEAGAGAGAGAKAKAPSPLPLSRKRERGQQQQKQKQKQQQQQQQQQRQRQRQRQPPQSTATATATTASIPATRHPTTSRQTKTPGNAGRFGPTKTATDQATVEERRAAIRSSSGGWLMNSFLAAEPAIPNAAICVGKVLWPWLSFNRSSAAIIF